MSENLVYYKELLKQIIELNAKIRKLTDIEIPENLQEQIDELSKAQEELEKKFENLEVPEIELVVPDKNENKRGTPGLVAMYNESSGLRLDENKRICVAAANPSDTSHDNSVNRPIVPHYIKEYLQKNSFNGNIADILANDVNASTPASVIAVKNFVNAIAKDFSTDVDNNAKKIQSVENNLINFKAAYIEPNGGTFEIKPGMIILALPYGTRTLTFHKKNTSDATITNMGTTMVMSSDILSDDKTTTGNHRIAVIYQTTEGFVATVKSNHNQYTPGCYLKNNYTKTGTESGLAYVFYISRGDG